ncbi:MAG: hypothetical protein QM784_04245 [Polyangiaceae bacterium]
MIVRLDNSIRNYAWGSLDGIAQFLGRPHASTTPEAELWIGAHPDEPSIASVGTERVRLDALVARSPEQLLGARVQQRFGSTLPYLLKVLAAGSPRRSRRIRPSSKLEPDSTTRSGVGSREMRQIEIIGIATTNPS